MTPQEAVIAKFASNRQRSLAFLRGLSPEAWSSYQQGVWRLHDVVAHLIGWSYASAQALQELSRNQPPSYDAYNHDDWADINAIFIRRYGSNDPTELINGLRAAGESVVATARNLPAQAFEQANGVVRKHRQWTVYVELDDTSDHEVRHMERAARALGKGLPQT